MASHCPGMMQSHCLRHVIPNVETRLYPCLSFLIYCFQSTFNLNAIYSQSATFSYIDCIASKNLNLIKSHRIQDMEYFKFTTSLLVYACTQTISILLIITHTQSINQDDDMIFKLTKTQVKQRLNLKRQKHSSMLISLFDSLSRVKFLIVSMICLCLETIFKIISF